MIFLCTDCGELHPMGPNDDECPRAKRPPAAEDGPMEVVCQLPYPLVDANPFTINPSTFRR
jgi:hypothetical protein